MARIDIRVSDFEKEELCRLARAAGVTVTDFIRQRCLGAEGFDRVRAREAKASNDAVPTNLMVSAEFHSIQAPFEKPKVEPPPPLQEKVVKKPGALCFACKRRMRVGLWLPEKCGECGR